MRKAFLTALAAFALVFFSGCAVLSENHRHASRFLDENLNPQSAALEVALAPVALPAGMAAVLVDATVVNPILAFPKAADNAVAVFRDVEYTGIAEIWVFPMRIAAFPIVFVGSELIRCFFPVDW